MIKHKFAENYRNVYNFYIDNLVEIVNEKFTEQQKFSQTLDRTNLEELEKYIMLTTEVDKAFDHLVNEARKVNNVL